MRALRCIGTVLVVGALAGAALVARHRLPDLHLRVRDAKDIAAYLATLN
jgi:hypothetical protein